MVTQLRAGSGSSRIVRSVVDPTSLWWLRSGDGVAKRVTASGLLIGRSPRCDVVIRSPNSSRRQALVYLDQSGPRLSVMGRGTVTVDDAEVEVDVQLPEGATVAVGDLTLKIVREAVSTDASAHTVWVLEGPDGGLFSFSHSPFQVGGSADDDLRVAQWPDHALKFHASESTLDVEPLGAIEVDGTPSDAGTVVRLNRGSRVTLDGLSVRIVTGGEFGDGSTVSLEPDNVPGARSARLEFLPRGGRLHVRIGGPDEHSVYLTDRRCDFIAVLLQPPPPLVPGDFVADEHLWARVWGKQPSGKKTLHVLLHRLRKDLDRVGLAGAALLERAEGGGATRFRLRDGARVTLE